MCVRSLGRVPAQPPEPPAKSPVLTAPMVWLVGLVLGFTAVMKLIGHVDLVLAFGLALSGVMLILGVIGIGRGASTVYRDVAGILRRVDNGEDRS